MTEALDNLNCVRLFWEVLVGRIKPTPRIYQDEILKNAPTSCLVTDCKGLFDAVDRNKSAGPGLSEKRTAIEALSIRQVTSLANVAVKWVNSDRQLADILTKQGVLTENVGGALQSNEWRIVFDETFTSAKNLRKQKRDAHFKRKVDQQKDSADRK